MLVDIDLMPSILHLTWQWPAGREKESSCRAKITQIYPDKKSFLNPPSFTNYLPDPFIIEADVLDRVKYQSIQLRLPALEIDGLHIDDLIELDLVGEDSCIAIRKYK